MHLFVGLGNPGPEYARHRHNVGFMAVDAIARRWRAPAWRRKFRGAFSEVVLDGERVLLLKPLTFMNESGRSVAEAVHFYRLPLERVVVFHDELDLAPGRVRVKVGGGTAGHNGLRSIASHLGSADFVRVRIGIGHPGHKDRVVPWVLSDFAKSDAAWLEPLLEAIAEAAPRLAQGDLNGYVNAVTVSLQRQRADRPEDGRASGTPPCSG